MLRSTTGSCPPTPTRPTEVDESSFGSWSESYSTETIMKVRSTQTCRGTPRGRPGTWRRSLHPSRHRYRNPPCRCTCGDSACGCAASARREQRRLQRQLGERHTSEVGAIATLSRRASTSRKQPQRIKLPSNLPMASSSPAGGTSSPVTASHSPLVGRQGPQCHRLFPGMHSSLRPRHGTRNDQCPTRAAGIRRARPSRSIPVADPTHDNSGIEVSGCVDVAPAVPQLPYLHPGLISPCQLVSRAP